MDGRLQIFTGNANRALAEAICHELQLPLGRALVSTFSDGETRVRLDENVRGSDVFVIQPGAAPVDHHIMELLLMLEALKRDPNNFDALVQLGNLYYDHHIFPEAIDYYTRALALRPNEVNVRTDLGTAYWYAGFPEKAVAEYEKSLAVDATHVNTLFNMGVVRMEGLKDAQGAAAAFEKVLRQNLAPQQRARAEEMLARARQQGAK